MAPPQQKWTRAYLKTLEVRFWSQVRKIPGGCWEWQGSVGSHGRGQISVRPLKPNGPVLVHRLSWRLHYGPIPRGLHVLHHCDNPICVRPDHLFVGTPQDNCDDKIAKGRMRHGHLYGDDHPLRKNPALAARGERHGGAVLTESEVNQIRKLAAQKAQHQDLADYFGVSRPAITAIVNRRTWRHV